MEKVRIKVRGKVNLSLNIAGTKNKMHVLESVTSSLEIFDTLDIRFDLSGKCIAEFLPLSVAKVIPEENSVSKAVNFLSRYYPGLGARISVRKGIPIAGGLGGSGADAAAVLYAAKLMLPPVKSDIVSESVIVGSDVPALIRGGCLLISSIGEKSAPVKAKRLHIVVARGEGGVSASEAYALFDAMYPSHRFCPANTEALISALRNGDLSGIANAAGNALLHPAVKLCPEIDLTIAALRDKGALFAFMTGSGSCCCGIFDCAASARMAAEELRKRGLYAVYAPTVSKGITHTFLR